MLLSKTDPQDRWLQLILVFIMALVAIPFVFFQPIKLDEPLVYDYLFSSTLQPDHYGLFYWICDLLNTMGASQIFSLRLLNGLILIFAQLLFFKVLGQFTLSQKLKLLLFSLSLSNFYLLNYTIYGYEYSLFYLYSILIFYSVARGYLENTEKHKVLLLINIFGLMTFAFSYLIIISQFLTLLAYRKKIKTFFFYHVPFVALHSIIYVYPILKFRSKDSLSELSKTGFEAWIDFVGFDLASLQQNLYQSKLLYLALALLSLIYLFIIFRFALIKASQLFVGFFQISLNIAVGVIVVLFISGFREIEARYIVFVFALFPLAIAQLLSIKASVWLKRCLYLMFFAKLIGLALFLKWVHYADPLQFVNTLHSRASEANYSSIASSHFWNFRHLVLPLFKLTPSAIDLRLVQLDNNTLKPKDKILYLKYYESDSSPPPNLDQYDMRYLQTISAPRTDHDKLELFELVRK